MSYDFSSSVGLSISNVQMIETAISSIISTNFANTLGKVPDIVKIVKAQLYKESSFNFTNSAGPPYGQGHLKTLLNYPAIANVYPTFSKEQQANVIQANGAFGLGQVTGSYLIIGADPTGAGELYRMNPKLAGPLMVPPGVPVTSVLWGHGNIGNQVLASLIVLDYYYRTTAPALVQSGQFSSLIGASLGSYLGLVGSDSLGSTAQSYVAQILGGSAYAAANGSAGYAAAASQLNPNGPTKTSASGNNMCMPGCA